VRVAHVTPRTALDAPEQHRPGRAYNALLEAHSALTVAAREEASANGLAQRRAWMHTREQPSQAMTAMLRRPAGAGDVAALRDRTGRS